MPKNHYHSYTNHPRLSGGFLSELHSKTHNSLTSLSKTSDNNHKRFWCTSKKSDTKVVLEEIITFLQHGSVNLGDKSYIYENQVLNLTEVINLFFNATLDIMGASGDMVEFVVDSKSYTIHAFRADYEPQDNITLVLILKPLSREEAERFQDYTPEVSKPANRDSTEEAIQAINKYHLVIEAKARYEKINKYGVKPVSHLNPTHVLNDIWSTFLVKFKDAIPAGNFVNLTVLLGAVNPSLSSGDAMLHETLSSIIAGDGKIRATAYFNRKDDLWQRTTFDTKH